MNGLHGYQNRAAGGDDATGVPPAVAVVLLPVSVPQDQVGYDPSLYGRYYGILTLGLLGGWTDGAGGRGAAGQGGAASEKGGRTDEGKKILKNGRWDTSVEH